MYLFTQVADLGMPMVCILNMMDVAEKAGMKVDSKKLSAALGCPVIETIGIKGIGTGDIAAAIQDVHSGKKVPNKVSYSPAIEECAASDAAIIADQVRPELVRWVSLKMIEREEMVIGDLDKDVVDRALAAVSEMESKTGDDGSHAIASARYDAGNRIRNGCISRKIAGEKVTRFSDKVDRILLNRIAAIPIFIVVMYAVYFVSVQTVGTVFSDFINDGFVEWIKHEALISLSHAGVDPMLVDLVVSGIIGGVGAVLGFLPLIVVLFLCLALLEEVGYMARVAYVLDRIFTRFGLSGKAVIPAVIGIGCGVPAIMGTRTIEDESNRNVSVMATTFMPCGAKLPILTVIISAFFGASALVTLSLYLLGIVMILVSGLFLKKFPGFIGKPSPFIMELPVYHMPDARNVLTGVTEKSWAFVRKAGTLILLSAVIIWTLSSFTWSFQYLGDGTTSGSMLSDIGKALCWIFIPNGFGGNDLWELTVASITGLMAKENLLATVAVLIDAAVDADDMPTTGALVAYLGHCAFPYAVAMSFLIFNLLCAPCFAAIGAMHRELGSWKRTLLAVLYQCATAYGVSVIFYQLVLLCNGVVGVGIVWLVIALAVPLYVMISKDPLAPFRSLMKKEAA